MDVNTFGVQSDLGIKIWHFSFSPWRFDRYSLITMFQAQID